MQEDDDEEEDEDEDDEVDAEDAVVAPGGGVQIDEDIAPETAGAVEAPSKRKSAAAQKGAPVSKKWVSLWPADHFALPALLHRCIVVSQWVGTVCAHRTLQCQRIGQKLYTPLCISML